MIATDAGLFSTTAVLAVVEALAVLDSAGFAGLTRATRSWFIAFVIRRELIPLSADFLCQPHLCRSLPEPRINFPSLPGWELKVLGKIRWSKEFLKFPLSDDR